MKTYYDSNDNRIEVDLTSNDLFDMQNNLYIIGKVYIEGREVKVIIGIDKPWK